MADPQYVKDFIRQLTPFAVAVGDQYGIDPETIITQAAIETGWGREVAGNNYFGVKSHGKPGGQNVVTHEEINGKRVKLTDSFRKYNSLEESVADYGRFLSENPRYAEALAQSGPEELSGIANAGYATSSKYPDLVKGVGRTVTRNIQPLPPGEIPTVASLLDTQRPAPTPAIQSPNGQFLRQNTSPLGDNTELQPALQRVATALANRVEPQTRRPELPAMGTPDLGSIYAGIYPQQQVTPQSIIERGTARVATPQGDLTQPGAIDASVASAGANTNSALKAALTRLAGGSKAVQQSQIERTQLPIGQSQIERGTTPIVQATAPKPRVTVSTPSTTPQSPIERGAARTVTPSTIGQPPATRVVQSIPMPALAAAATAIPQSFAGQDGGAPRTTPVPDRLSPSKGLPELFGNANIGGADIMRFGVPLEVVAPVPAVRPATFRTELRPMQIANPAWKPTPAAGTPMSGGLSRDAVALRAKGLAQAQAMAQVPRTITVQRPVQVAIQPRPVAAALAQQPLRIAVNGAGVAPQPLTVVQQLQAQGLSPAAAYAAANRGSGSSDAADRVNGSSTRGSGGARSLMD